MTTTESYSCSSPSSSPGSHSNSSSSFTTLHRSHLPLKRILFTSCSPFADVVAIASPSTISLHRISLHRIRSISLPSPPTAVTWSPDGTAIAVTLKSGIVRLASIEHIDHRYQRETISSWSENSPSAFYSPVGATNDTRGPHRHPSYQNDRRASTISMPTPTPSITSVSWSSPLIQDKYNRHTIYNNNNNNNNNVTSNITTLHRPHIYHHLSRPDEDYADVIVIGTQDGRIGIYMGGGRIRIAVKNVSGPVMAISPPSPLSSPPPPSLLHQSPPLDVNNNNNNIDNNNNASLLSTMAVMTHNTEDSSINIDVLDTSVLIRQRALLARCALEDARIVRAAHQLHQGMKEMEKQWSEFLSTQIGDHLMTRLRSMLQEDGHASDDTDVGPILVRLCASGTTAAPPAIQRWLAGPASPSAIQHIRRALNTAASSIRTVLTATLYPAIHILIQSLSRVSTPAFRHRLGVRAEDALQQSRRVLRELHTMTNAVPRSTHNIGILLSWIESRSDAQDSTPSTPSFLQDQILAVLRRHPFPGDPLQDVMERSDIVSRTATLKETATKDVFAGVPEQVASDMDQVRSITVAGGVPPSFPGHTDGGYLDPGHRFVGVTPDGLVHLCLPPEADYVRYAVQEVPAEQQIQSVTLYQPLQAGVMLQDRTSQEKYIGITNDDDIEFKETVAERLEDAIAYTMSPPLLQCCRQCRVDEGAETMSTSGRRGIGCVSYQSREVVLLDMENNDDDGSDEDSDDSNDDDD